MGDLSSLPQLFGKNERDEKDDMEEEQLILPHFDEDLIKILLPFFHMGFLYHRYEVKGLHHVPRKGPAILCVNHSFATYDAFFLGAKIYLETGRSPCGLGDSNLFCTEKVEQFSRRLRLAEASHQNAEKLLLQEKELMMLAPGGMREALRPTKTQAGQILWDKRMGFARLAVRTQTPVLLAACPQADEIFDIYPTEMTKYIYKKFKLPFVFLKGLGPSLIPKPVKLVHTVSAPFTPPQWNEPRGVKEEEFERVVEEFHHHLVKEMNKLLKQETNESP